MIVETFSADETYEYGRKMGAEAQPGDVYCLTGDLGVGKTVFTQGFAAGLGVREPVSSPTFTIVQEYEGEKMPFYHFDVYRIGDAEEMEEIGFEDYVYGQGVCLIEWANLIREILPEDFMGILIEKDMEKGFDSEVYVCEEIRYYKTVFDWEDNGFNREYYKILKTEVN